LTQVGFGVGDIDASPHGNSTKYCRDSPLHNFFAIALAFKEHAAFYQGGFGVIRVVFFLKPVITTDEPD
jgi:hypothetical protein